MENNPKNQVVERLREAQNILVTVSTNPSVDQLSAAIGFTLMMNKLGKHATAVFSGQVPGILDFLKPKATLEQNTDSLRDFIISLDKAKADKLRYKVEDDFVKIFITPYRTSLTEADLDFAQGDFNVDVVMALGVDQRANVDQAILAHGRILHDATVVGVMAGPNAVDIGSINWRDEGASSLCEMLVSISESFQSGLLDGQMATAYLTGIVAETERFSNQKTSPKVMTMSAQLMAAGANQQLISTQLTPVEPDLLEDLPAPLQADEPAESDEIILELDHSRDEEDRQVSEQAEAELDRAEEPENLNTPEQLARAVNDVQVSAEETNDVPDDEPQQLAKPEEELQQSSKYIYEPPINGGTLTANSHPEVYDPSTDPMSASVHNDSVTQEHDKPVITPLLGVTDDAESVQATSMTSTETPLLQSDGETNPTSESPQDPNGNIPSASSEVESDIPVINKLGPEVHDKDKLADIEQAVENFTGTVPHIAADTDAARDAVTRAVASAGYDTKRPEPIKALNAQEIPQSADPTELDIQTSPTEPVPVVASEPPPSVPPPMTPQFPIPGAEVYEPDQDRR